MFVIIIYMFVQQLFLKINFSNVYHILQMMSMLLSTALVFK